MLFRQENIDSYKRLSTSGALSPSFTQVIVVVNKKIIVFSSFLNCIAYTNKYIDRMTIDTKTLKLIKNSHIEERDMLLDKLLKNANISQASFAKKVGKDASTVNRWIKNNRSIAWENAEKIAKVLNCHPVDIYKPQHEITLRKTCTWDGLVTDIDKDDQIDIVVPYEFYHTDLKAVMMESPGTPSDGEIWLFDIPKIKKFTKYAIGKICYITASEKFKKAHGKTIDSHEWYPLIALVKPMGNGKLKIVNSYTDELLNPLCDNLTYDDFDIATPVKAKYDPDLINLQLK